jgi:Bacterial SH3 domain
MANGSRSGRSAGLALLVVLTVVVLAFWGAGTTVAQVTATPGGVTCAQLIPMVQKNLSANCNSLDRDQLCYGNRSVTVEYADNVRPDKPFAQVGDFVPLKVLKSINTGPLNLATGEWGLAVMKVQAMVPGATAGQAVTFVLYGDTHITQMTTADTTAPAAPVCTATTIRTTYLRGTADANGQQLQLLQPNTTVNIIGRLANTQWLQAEYQGKVGWVFATTVKLSCDFNSLPSVGPSQPLTLPGMSAFYVTTGINANVACQDIPPGGMLVQSPQGQKVTFRVNGADLTIGSDVILRAIPNQSFTASVITGELSMRLPNAPANARPLIVPAGQEVTVPLGGTGGAGLVGQALIARIPRNNALHLKTLCDMGLNIPCDVVPPTPTRVPATRVPRPTQRPTVQVSPTQQASQPNCTFTVQRFTAIPNPAKLVPRSANSPAAYCTTLYWDVEGIQTVYLNGKGVVGHGSQQVCIQKNTTYVLTMNCGGKTQTRSLTVTIK